MAPTTTTLIAKNKQRLAAFHGDRLHCQAARPTDAANMPVANCTESTPKIGTNARMNFETRPKPKQMTLISHSELVSLKSNFAGRDEAAEAILDFFHVLRKMARAIEVRMKNTNPVDDGVRTGTSPKMPVVIAVAALND